MSTQITAEQVKNLRDQTGVSVMQCRNALIEAEGDLEKALIILKGKSSGIAVKKADRDAKNGIVLVREKDNKGIIVTLHSETDFLVKNEDFINLANKLADIAINDGLSVLNEKSPDMINEIIQKTGEKIILGNISEINGNVLGSYVHNNKSAVIVALSESDKDVAKDVAMHIAAMKPVYTTMEDVTDNDKTKVIEVFEKEVAESDKPEDIKKKMLDGKINTYFKEQTLMEQAFIKNPNITIKQLLSDNKTTLSGFIRESVE